MTVCSPSSASGWRSYWPSDRSVVFALAIPLAAYFPSAGWHGGASPSGRCIAIGLLLSGHLASPFLLMVVRHAALHSISCMILHFFFKI